MTTELIDAFRDTLQVSMCEQLRPSTEQSIQDTEVYFEGFRHCRNTKGEEPPSWLAAIEITAETTFAAAKRYAPLGKTAVLNFANPEVPGGGVEYGARAQEECLCRCSNLYPSISSPAVFQDYYRYNTQYRYYYTDRLLYTPNIIVFKDEQSIPQFLPAEEWFRTDVITCAAPMSIYMAQVDEKELKTVMKSRIRNIFEAAADHHVQNLILGAFGCGAFRNPPRLVADAFREVILENGYDSLFPHIVFAIKKTGAVCPNLEAFRAAFAQMPDGPSRLRQLRRQRQLRKLLHQL